MIRVSGDIKRNPKDSVASNAQSLLLTPAQHLFPALGGSPSFQSPSPDSVETPLRNKQVCVHSFCKNTLPQLSTPTPPPDKSGRFLCLIWSGSPCTSWLALSGSYWSPVDGLLGAAGIPVCLLDSPLVCGTPNPHLHRPASRSHWRLGTTLPDGSQARLQPRLPSRFSRPQAPSPCAPGTDEGVRVTQESGWC